MVVPARPLYLQPSFLGLVVTLFLVSFWTDVQSKRILTQHPDLPITLTAAQFLMSTIAGWLLIRVTQGRIQPLPNTWSGCLPLLPMTAVQTLGAFTTTQSFGAMAVGFTHTIKATEPIATAFLARVLMHDRFTLGLYLSLVPIIGGVCLASLTEISFSWFGVAMALTSNVCFAARAVLIGKQVALQRAREADLLEAQRRQQKTTPMTTGDEVELAEARSTGEKTLAAAPSSAPSPSPLQLDPGLLHLDDLNTFFYVCLFSTAAMAPLVLCTEYTRVVTIVAEQHARGNYSLLWQLAIGGLGQYTYTAASLCILSRTSPITHVVLHALRRVYVLFLSIFLRDGHLRAVTLQSLAGTMLVLVGAVWFAREKGRQKKAPGGAPTDKKTQ